MSQDKNYFGNFRTYNVLKGKKYRHHADDKDIVKIMDIVDAKIYFRVDGVEIPRMITLVLYMHDNMLYVDEVVTFNNEYSLVEPVYEYKFAVKIICSTEEGFVWEMSRHYYTIEEAPENINAEYKLLEFTKRERKCQ